MLALFPWTVASVGGQSGVCLCPLDQEAKYLEYSTYGEKKNSE